MDEVLDSILTERQQILLAICRYLGFDTREKTINDIHQNLALKGMELNSNSSVLYKYMRFLEEKQLVKVNIKGKTKHYSLVSQNSYEYVKIGEEDKPFLQILIKSLENYSNLPLTDELNQLIQKDKNHKDLGVEFKVVELDSTHNHEHTQYLTFLYYRILDIETVSFHYKKYEEEISREIELEPYLLKEYNKRWYVIGKKVGDDDGNYSTFALDRIESIDWERPAKEFVRNQSFDPENYWNHSVGLFRGKPEIVSFELKNDFMNNIDFIKTSPIHKSQRITELDEQWIQVHLYVYPSYELVRELRKYGVNNIRNLTPKTIKL